MRRAMPRPPPHAMADSAASFSSRSRGVRPAKGRARAATAGDEHSAARTAVDPQPQLQVLPDDAGEAGENMPSLHFDPRQGTLLGFELPAEAFVSMTAGGQRAAGEPVGVTEGANLPGSNALAEGKPVTAEEPIVEERPATAQKPIVEEKPSTAQKPIVEEQPATAQDPVAGENPAAAQQPVAGETPVAADKRAVARRAGGPARTAAARKNTSAAPHGAKGAHGAVDTRAADHAATSSKAETPELDQQAEASAAKAQVSAGSPDDASLASQRVPLLSPGAALASVRQQGARRSADATRAAAKGVAAQPGAMPMSAGDITRAGRAAQVLPLPPAEQPALAGGAEHETPQPFDAPEANMLTQTVASLQAVFDQAQHAAQARWRRTRHWLALTLAALAVLLIVSVAQTVALIGFVHRSEAAQQQAQSALSQQQAALASLASAVSALPARGQGVERSTSPADGAAAPATTAQQPAKRATGTHARHAAERSKAATH